MQIGKITFSPFVPRPIIPGNRNLWVLEDWQNSHDALEREISQLKIENLRLRNTVRSLLESAKHGFEAMGWKTAVELAHEVLIENKYDT